MSSHGKKQTRGKILKRRKSKWNNEYRLPIAQAAVYVWRNGGMNTVQIEKKFGIPPRTLKRYVTWSKDPESPIYLRETILPDGRINLFRIMRDTILPNLAVIDPLVADIVLQQNTANGPARRGETIYEYENRCNISTLVDSSKSIINELLNSDPVDKFDDIYEFENSDDIMRV